MQDLNTRVLKFLQKWMNDNKVPQIRKGMPEELEAFVESEISLRQAQAIAEGMRSRAEATDAKDS